MEKKLLQICMFLDGVCDQVKFFFCFFQAVLFSSDFIDGATVFLCKDYVLIHDYLPAFLASSFAMLSAMSRSLASGVMFLLMIFAAISQERTAT